MRIFSQPIPREFYNRPTLIVARELLGKYLYRKYQSSYLVGKIVEVEAYIGQTDPACHAAVGKTARNAVMFGPPGYAYVYFIYGVHYCLNVVTEAEGFPAAVLIRALEPVQGIEIMKKLRKIDVVENLTNGPGKLCQALAIDRRLNGADLCGNELFISEGEPVAESQIARSPRIGIRVGTEHHWRFYLKDNPFVSK